MHCLLQCSRPQLTCIHHRTDTGGCGGTCGGAPEPMSRPTALTAGGLPGGSASSGPMTDSGSDVAAARGVTSGGSASPLPASRAAPAVWPCPASTGSDCVDSTVAGAAGASAGCAEMESALAACRARLYCCQSWTTPCVGLRPGAASPASCCALSRGWASAKLGFTAAAAGGSTSCGSGASSAACCRRCCCSCCCVLCSCSVGRGDSGCGAGPISPRAAASSCMFRR